MEAIAAVLQDDDFVILVLDAHIVPANLATSKGLLGVQSQLVKLAFAGFCGLIEIVGEILRDFRFHDALWFPSSDLVSFVSCAILHAAVFSSHNNIV